MVNLLQVMARFCYTNFSVKKRICYSQTHIPDQIALLRGNESVKLKKNHIIALVFTGFSIYLENCPYGIL